MPSTFTSEPRKLKLGLRYVVREHVYSNSSRPKMPASSHDRLTLSSKADAQRELDELHKLGSEEDSHG